MIHDAQVEVTCDKCQESVYIELDYVYSGIMGTQGRYDDSDSKIEKKLEKMDWIVSDDKHYCSEDCAQADENFPG